MPRVQRIDLFEERRKTVGNPRERRKIGSVSIPGKGKERERNVRAINKLLGKRIAGSYAKGNKFRKK